MTHISFDRRSFNRVFLCGADTRFMDMKGVLVPFQASSNPNTVPRLCVSALRVWT